jgi:hypothetical protein
MPNDRPENNNQDDSLAHIDMWINILEDYTKRLFATFDPEEVEQVKGAMIAGRFITIIARLISQRQRFLLVPDNTHENILRLIFGDATEEWLTDREKDM